MRYDIERDRANHLSEKEKKMFPLKLVRSLLLGETINIHLQPENHQNDDEPIKNTKTRTPLLIFLPTKELISDTYRLATIAREMGIDLYPTPSLSHIIFAYPSFSASSSQSQSSSWSSLILPNDAVALPFPSFSSSSLSHLRSFVSLSKGVFKLVFITNKYKSNKVGISSSSSHWNCCSVSLFSRLNGDRIDTMEAFSRSLAGMGWTLFKTGKNPCPDSSGNSVYLFRKVDSCGVRARIGNGGCRMREVRLPAMDFGNAPLRILQYVVLMTDDVFYLS